MTRFKWFPSNNIDLIDLENTLNIESDSRLSKCITTVPNRNESFLYSPLVNFIYIDPLSTFSKENEHIYILSKDELMSALTLLKMGFTHNEVKDLLHKGRITT